ncbi:uncharacterized protein LOC130788883 [Actinidia eriantha]|uniref:uncharacterized protein LOC130788883 n=1 Tax=Actinidia eriantha TaxID=165200 RepID=UPI0025847269|nr:uncharacterized protein LOC130788883 [Actinidia eriantha]
MRRRVGVRKMSYCDKWLVVAVGACIRLPSAYDMILNIREMFEDQGRTARQMAIKELVNTSMAEETLVRDHVLKIIGHLNELEIIGVEINGESQINIKLQSAEGLIRKPVSTFVAEKDCTSKLKGKKKQKKNSETSCSA